MASLAPYNITLGGTDYPAKYAGLLAYIEPFLTNLETFSFSGGNVGLGVTPGTWAATAKAIEFTYPTYGQDSAGSAFMSFNARESSAGNWVYKTTDEASRFVANTDGSFRFFNAPSGTAGNAISFTQAMTLTSGGDLLVGTTTSSAKLTVESSSLVAKFVRTTAGGIAQFQNGDNAGYGIDLLNVAGTSAGSIFWTATTTTYATSSDARLKENISDADSASSLIDAIKVRKFDWKEDGGHQRYGFVAQELLPVAPEAVSTPADDPDGLMGVDYSKLVPMLIKEIQSLRARVAALEQA
jgi:hypothetical protein